MKYFLFILTILSFVSCSDSGTESAKKCNTSEECGNNYYCNANICIKSTCTDKNKDSSGKLCLNGELCNIYTGKCDEVVECDVNSLPVKTDELCGLNGTGTMYKYCLDGQYDLQCVDIDICVNDAILTVPCGENNIGEQPQKCVNGQWVNNGECIIETVCTENDTQIVSCGLNGNGSQNQICTNSEWINDGDCEDDDICVNGDPDNAVCDIFNNDGDGTKTRICTNGQWGDFGVCVDPDECRTDSVENILCDVLNSNNNGTKIRVCIDGQWGEWSDCNDPDVCVNGNTENLTCDVFNDTLNGTKTRICTNGQWGAYSNCNDPDACENGTETSQSCGLNANGRQPLICDNAHWIVNGVCVDPDVCVNNNTRDDVTICGYNENGLQREICVSGQWADNTYCEPNESDCHDGCLDPDECMNDTMGNAQCGFEQTNSSHSVYCIDGEWICSVFAKSEGTTLTDVAIGVTVDGNKNIYVTGVTYGNFDGIPNNDAGCAANPTNEEICAEAFLVKYSPFGVKLWSKTIGKSGYDMGVRVSTDNSNNVYVAGNTKTSLAGTNKGSEDIFLIKYNSDGNYIWGIQEGTAQKDNVGGFVINGPKIYLAGTTEGTFAGQSNYGSSDAILIKFQDIDTATVSAEYYRQFGTSNADVATSITKIGDNQSAVFYIGGFTDGVFSNNTDNAARDLFLASYAVNGTQRFVKQWGTDADDRINAITTDSSGVIYVAGSTMGSFTEAITRADSDSFVSKIIPGTTSGNTSIAWNKQFNSVNNGADNSNSITSDGTYLYLVGDTTSNITTTTTHYGVNDVFMLKIDNSGNIQNSKQWGSTLSDAGFEIIYKNSFLHIIGQTKGDFYDNLNSTQPPELISDMFLIRWNE